MFVRLTPDDDDVAKQREKKVKNEMRPATTTKITVDETQRDDQRRRL